MLDTILVNIANDGAKQSQQIRIELGSTASFHFCPAVVYVFLLLIGTIRGYCIKCIGNTNHPSGKRYFPWVNRVISFPVETLVVQQYHGLQLVSPVVLRN